MKDSDFRALTGKYFTTLAEWRSTRSEVKKQKCKRIEAKIIADNDRYFKRIEANRQRKLPM